MFNLQLPLPTPPPPPPAKQKPKPKIKALTVLPVVIIIVSVVGALYFSSFFSDFGIAPNSSQNTSPSHSIAPSQSPIVTASPLTPARDIEGTWVTPIATEFLIATDFQNFGTLEDVGSEYRTMTWTITPTQDENTVNVYIAFTTSNRNLIDGSGYTPDVSPMQLTGTISGTQLTLTRGDQGPVEQVGSVGVFTFTSTQMEGTWHDHWTGVYEQNVYTQTNGLKLMKQ